MKEALKLKQPISSLVNICVTIDQSKCVMAIVDTISQKTLKHTLSISAGRGRVILILFLLLKGKSAALGLGIASSIVYGYSNIFVTAPSPENLKTLFQFIFKGLDALNYQEHKDYDILESTNPEFKNCVIRINIHRDHRQTIQYIQPQEYRNLSILGILLLFCIIYNCDFVY